MRWRGLLQAWSEPGGTARAHFVTITGNAAAELAARVAVHRVELGRKPGGGGAKVTAGIGGTRWTSQVMPQPGGGWVMPVKIAVVRAEGLREGDPIVLELEI